MLSVIFIIIGICALSAGSFYLFKDIRMVKQGNTVTASVVENRCLKRQIKEDSLFARKFYFAVLRYEINGVQYTQQNRNESKKPKYQEGDVLKIYYNAANPANFIIDGERLYNFTLYALSIIAGLFFLICGIYYII